MVYHLTNHHEFTYNDIFTYINKLMINIHNAIIKIKYIPIKIVDA